MGSSLFIGRFDRSALRKVARDYVAASSDLAPADQAALCKAWERAPKEVAYVDALNLASIVLFLKHTAELEGVAVKGTGENSRWRHLPYWIYSHWLPVRTAEARVVEGLEAAPLFFGSAYALLDDLAAIAALSPLKLGTTPPYFELMLADPREFYDLTLAPFEDQTTIQWIWRALFEGAQLSIKHNAPLRSA